MKLSTRLAIAMVCLVAVTVAAVGFLTYYNLERTFLPRALDRIETDLRLATSELQAQAGSVRADVAAMGAAGALEGLIRAHVSGGVDPNDGTLESTWRERMTLRFTAELRSKPNYLQFRLIGAEGDGLEIIRVDRAVAGAPPRVVPPQELQRRGDRAFFKEAIKLRPGEIHIAPIDLSQANGKIEVPFVPVLRAATPVFRPDGRPFGIVIINLDMRPAFERIRAGVRAGADIYVVGENGDYLLSPEPDQEFGSDRGKPTRWQNDFPGLASAATSRRTATQIMRDDDGDRGGAGLAMVQLAGGPSVGVIETVPNAIIMAAAAPVRDTSLLVGTIAVLFAGGLAILLARTLSSPLVQITRAVDRFPNIASGDIPVRLNGEVGVLARAFNRVLGDLAGKAAALQQGEAALHESERMARGIVDTALDAFVQMDEAGSVIGWNSQAESIFGWSHREAIGRNLRDLIVPGVQRATYDTSLDALRHDKSGSTPGFRLEFEAMRGDGKELYVELSLTLFRRQEGYVFNGFIRDLTAKVAAEAQFRQAQKMEAVGQLTGGVAHDFNNILTVITGTIEILADAVADRPELAAIAAMIDEAAERGADLTKHLLAFARRQPLQPREIDLNALIASTGKLLRPTLGEQIEIETVFAVDAWPAFVDPSQLTTALLNLALNARDAMPGGGKLTIETKNVELDESYAALNTDMKPGDYVMLAVSDTGIGIPADQIDKVFEPFFTTKETGKGTGLGLSMVYGFVKQSEGHIKIYSEEGHGTTIRLYLPKNTMMLEQAADPRETLTIEGGSELVLVVEDDALVRNYVIAQIRSLGYRTLSANNADAALRILEDDPSIELLFTDVIMPGAMNGRQLVDAALRFRPSLRVLYTSGYTENAIVHHGRLDAGVLLLAKPYRKSDLARMMRLALDAVS